MNCTSKIMHYMDFLLDKQSQGKIASISTTALLLITAFDVVTGPELSSSLFYLLPISIAAWYGNRATGILFALLSTVALFSADTFSGDHYSYPAIIYWNTMFRMGIFFIFAILIATLRLKLRQEQESAITDSLTGAANSRAMYELLEKEIIRSRRYGQPISLAFIDLDNFKHVNDTQGHLTGDAALRKVTAIIRDNIRKTDVVARLGGDEFAVLLVETGGADSATAIANLKEKLVAGMAESSWPVGFSIGLVTFETPPGRAEEIIKLADELMYSVKKYGKNNIRHRVIRKGIQMDGDINNTKEEYHGKEKQ